MKTENIEYIFLAYANSSLRRDQENIRKIFSELQPFVFLPEQAQSDLNRLLDAFAAIGAKFDAEDAFRFAETHGDQLSAFGIAITHLPADIFGCKWPRAPVSDETFMKLRGNCLEKPLRQLALADVFNEIRDLKCHECDQLYVRYVLSQISKGAEYPDITGLLTFFGHGRAALRKEIRLEETAAGSAQRWGLREGLTPNSVEIFFSIRRFMLQIVSYSLAEFLLLPSNRNRLKECPLCGAFFIARDTKRRKCYSKDCNRLYHRNDMSRRRADDPLKYC